MQPANVQYRWQIQKSSVILVQIFHILYNNLLLNISSDSEAELHAKGSGGAVWIMMDECLEEVTPSLNMHTQSVSYQKQMHTHTQTNTV